MNQKYPLVSILINNFNYARFLPRSIESALGQTFKDIEVIVVDDGSTDESMEVARKYADRVKVISQPNGGQASAFNAGFAASLGDWILFLDADDWLDEKAIESIAPHFHPSLSKIHFFLREYHDETKVFGHQVPGRMLSQGDVVPEILANGDYVYPPTSGNIFSRRSLKACLPMPTENFKLCADFYICAHAAFSGPIGLVDQTLGYYRIHGQNNFTHFSLKKAKLFRQGHSILVAEALMAELLEQNKLRPVRSFASGCSVIETLVLAVRFGGLELSKYGLSLGDLESRWWNSRKRDYPSRLPLVWYVLRWAPACVVEVFMRLRIDKARRAGAGIAIAPMVPAN